MRRSDNARFPMRNIVMPFLLYVAWPCGIFCLFSVLAMGVMRSRYTAQSYAMEWFGVTSWPSLLVARTLGNWLAFAGASMIIATLVDFMAESVFTSTPLFNAKERPQYPAKMRVWHHGRFLLNSLPGVLFDELISDNPGPKPLAEQTTFSPSGGSLLINYALAATAVTITLLASDFLYYSVHYPQHKFRILYKLSGHAYHHTFRFPLAACGPWLDPLDMVVSALATFVLPVHIAIDPLHALGFFPNPSFWRNLLSLYIHEMNHTDHCGKQLPTWSGSPLCPPLGFALGLHESVAFHEAHHNFSSCGFGLLGVADRVFGTARYPKDHPKERYGKKTI